MQYGRSNKETQTQMSFANYVAKGANVRAAHNCHAQRNVPRLHFGVVCLRKLDK